MYLHNILSIGADINFEQVVNNLKNRKSHVWLLKNGECYMMLRWHRTTYLSYFMPKRYPTIVLNGAVLVLNVPLHRKNLP